ncbi:MAG: precorrin-3B C(17)-methyltransferase [Pseudomonadota bacterium]
MSADHAPAVICLTASGLAIAEAAAQALKGDLHGLAGRVETALTFEEVGSHARALFAAGRPLIGICAAGVLIRVLSPLLADKRAEPPVLALAEDGSSVIPLLGGHHGANALARLLADALGAHAAITTAGDLRFGRALDAPPPGWRLMNPSEAGPAMATALAQGAAPELERLWTKGGPRDLPLGETTLRYRPETLAVGVGCARGADPEAAIALVRATLAEAEDAGAEAAVAGVFSIDLKTDEAAVHAVADALGAPARFFDADTLQAERHRLQTPSERVFQEVGCHGVAEGAALAAVGPTGRLLIAKRKTTEATCAIAESPRPLSAAPDWPPGAPRGRLTVVGVGPGAADQRTPAASRAVAEAELLVGYGLYIDLLGALAAHKPRADFPLGGEEARCRHALEEAGRGRRVALVCSGDGGVYAMGALVLELLDRSAAAGGVSEAARRVELVMTPGVSALQSASARAGALLGHDFCAISLSDLLTPWETIEARVEAAARGDFVIAFYNPVSQKRRTQLARAQAILLAHRAAETPVVLARQLGRPGEVVRRTTLAALRIDEVDMLTTVLVGSSASRVVPSGDRAAGAQGAWVYTPRGYAAKRG